MLLTLSYRWGRKLEIIATHIHLDHASGAGLLARMLADRGWTVKIRVHPRGAPHIIDPSKLWTASLEALGDTGFIYGYPYPAPEDLVAATSDGEVERVGGVEVEYVHTPGHASHHQAVLLRLENSTVIAVGDASGIYVSQTGGVIPTTPPPFHADKYLASLERISKLAEESKATLIVPTHNAPAPTALISLHKQQMARWLSEAENFKGSPEEFLEYMISVDGLAAKAYTVLARSRHTRRTLLHTAEGMLAAVQRRT
jgi:hydroxyacylglutathione hydrolase